MEADILCETLEQYLKAYEAVGNGYEVNFDEGEILVRQYAPPPSAEGWTNRRAILQELSYAGRRIEITDELYVTRLKKRKKTRMDVELDAAYLPVPVQEHRLQRPYFLRFVLLVDSGGGMILNQKAVSPDEDIADVILDMLEDLVERSGRPRGLHVRDDELGGVVADWCEKLDVKLKMDVSMPVLDEAIGSLMDFLGVDED
jgi:hypothetical protein